MLPLADSDRYLSAAPAVLSTFQNHLRNVAGQRVAVPTPEVRAGLIAQQRFIFYQLLFEQHARLKGVKAEHTLTKTVDGKHRRFIHLSFSQ